MTTIEMVYDEVKEIRSVVRSNGIAIAKLQAEQAATAYIEARLEAYPAIGEQLDMLYKDMQNGTTNWQDLITQIKTDNPKG